MFSENLKFFGPTTLKWYPLKKFSKMRKNHLLTANIFSFINIRLLFWLKYVIWAKGDWAVDKVDNVD